MGLLYLDFHENKFIVVVVYHIVFHPGLAEVRVAGDQICCDGVIGSLE